MRYLVLLCVAYISLCFNSQPPIPVQRLGAGHIPVVVTDSQAQSHVVFGQDSTLYYTTSNSQNGNFDTPRPIATLRGLVAGAKRGAQLAVTDSYVVITAVDKAGDLYAYSLDRKTGHWSQPVRINDVPEIAKEGFLAVAAASASTFHCVWLDLRGDRHNKVMEATSRDGGRTWSANRLVYQSTSGSVCECCQVSLAAKGPHVYVQFRNWLDGSRDLYLAHSADGGRTWPAAQKLGVGTWKLNACPMDGGGVVLESTGQPLTAWRRENTLYVCTPGQAEQAVANGRNVTLASNTDGTALAWDMSGTVWIKMAKNEPIALGKGQLPRVAKAGKAAICVWEDGGQIMASRIP